ncbi:MAG TPA: TIM-barrel domain-containing protein [Gemmatimonadaceae bacterium]|nr:TIM-barrel domain-containing protein [Gemmatimonadaceae bacterium]
MRFAVGIVFFLALAPPSVAQSAGGSAEEIPLAWAPAADGVWRAVAGAPEAISLLAAAGAQPRLEALARMPRVDFPFARPKLRAFRRDGKLYLRIPLERSEQLYGLGLNFKALQQRGTVKELHVDHYGGSDNGRTHAPVPFYVSSAGYGVLVDAARYVTVYAGTAVRRDSDHPPPVKDRNTDRSWSSMPLSDAVEILVPASGATLYVFGGPTTLDAVRRYNLFSGGGVLPPKWGLGFLHRTPSLFTAGQVLAEADEFAKRGFPLDVVGLEPGWQSAAYPGTFAWDAQRFPDPAGFMRAMRSRGVRVNLWINPYVAPRAEFYKAVEPFSASHTVWTGIVPDFTLPQVRTLVLDYFRREHLALGVSGYKIDEVDGYDRWLWPDHAEFPSGLSGEQMRQIYGVVLQRATAEMFRAQDQRTWGLVRGSNAWAAALPYVIYNDSYSHPDFITALASSGFVGVLWTPEVRSSKTGEEWLRRMQSVCFSPLAMLNAWADGTKPWSFPEVEGAVRDAMLLRVRLLPYLYSAFARYHFDGTPPFRPMALEPGFRVDDEERTATVSSTDDPYAAATRRDVKDQFMVGADLLVAPMFAGQSSRTVILPDGKWFDFYSGAFVGGSAVVTVTPGLDRIPLFVRDGAIVPLIAGNPLRAPAAGERVDLEVRHYGTAPGRFDLYDDDGVTFGYERGAFSWTTLAVAPDRRGVLRGSVVRPARGRPFGYGEIRFTMMTRSSRDAARPTTTP